MQVEAMFINFAYSIIGGFLTLFFMFIGFKLLDKFTDFNTSKQLEKGNLAVGLVVLGMLVGIGIAIGLVIGMGLN